MATMSLGDALRAGAEITMTVEPRPPTPPPPEPEPACRWEAMWKRGLEPGDAFDVGGVSGALASYLKRAPRPPEGSAALVPGCGRAYDALALARHGFDRVVAVDIAPTAVRAAMSFLEDEADGYDEDLGIYYIQIKGTRFTKIEVYEVDFFDVPDKFDFIWDCTFLCALDPSLREKWATKQKALLDENGTLLSCIFPICEKVGGPPYALSVPLVTELLKPEGFEAVETRVCEGAERHVPGAMAGDDCPGTALVAWRLGKPDAVEATREIRSSH
jgi:SAM-dependent methyltransferase